MKKIWACLAAALLAALMAAPAGAAAAMAPTYVSSEPSDGEELHQAPERVEVTFSEPLDESSEISVEDSCGRKVDDGQVTVDGSSMSVGIAHKPSGHYQVSYTATGLAGVTGSTEGGFHFMVHFGEPCGGGGGGNRGGHNNHGGNGGGNGNGGTNQHNNHSGGGGTDQNEGGHMSSGHPSTGSGSAHKGTPAHDGGHRTSRGTSGGNHTNMHGGHGKNQSREGKHSAHAKLKSPDEPGGRTIAAGPGRPVPPDGQAVLLALGFSLALGAVGGWFLRVSAAR